MSWETVRNEGRVGTGNWDAVPNSALDKILAAAERWSEQTRGIDKLWLCWNISDAWSVIQQRIVISAGWTPVVGFDPNCKPASMTKLSDAIYIDFNKDLRFPAMWPHFPLEFAFLWAENKLGFWHADLLLREVDFNNYAKLFDSLNDGEMAAVHSTGGFRNILRKKTHRYWELLGCTTRLASLNQFEMGCGWWRNFHMHPNTPDSERSLRSAYYYDSGVGISFWESRFSGKIVRLNERAIRYGHFSEIGSKNYVKSLHKGKELEMNFDLQHIARQLAIERFL